MKYLYKYKIDQMTEGQNRSDDTRLYGLGPRRTKWKVLQNTPGASKV